MSTTFQAGDQTGDQGNGQGSSFDQSGGDNPNNGDQGGAQLTPEQIEVLTKRDEHAQGHISTLETEAKALRDELDSLKGKADQATLVEELMEKLDKQKNDGTTTDVDDVVRRVTESVTNGLQTQKQQEVAEGNFEQVKSALVAKYGDKTDVEVTAVAQKNGMSFEQLFEMASTNPTLVLNLCDAAKPAQSQQGNFGGGTQQFSQEQQEQVVKVTDLRTDKARVADFQRRMDAKLKELSQ